MPPQHADGADDGERVLREFQQLAEVTLPALYDPSRLRVGSFVTLRRSIPPIEGPQRDRMMLVRGVDGDRYRIAVSDGNCADVVELDRRQIAAVLAPGSQPQPSTCAGYVMTAPKGASIHDAFRRSIGPAVIHGVLFGAAGGALELAFSAALYGVALAATPRAAPGWDTKVVAPVNPITGKVRRVLECGRERLSTTQGDVSCRVLEVEVAGILPTSQRDQTGAPIPQVRSGTTRLWISNEVPFGVVRQVAWLDTPADCAPRGAPAAQVDAVAWQW